MNRYTEEEEFADDDYRESEDEDYNPDQEQQNKGSESDDSGDEEERKLASTYAQIQGDGGLIKSRAQKKKSGNVSVDEKPPSVVGEASVDVDALWAEMNSAPPRKPTNESKPTTESKHTQDKQSDSKIIKETEKSTDIKSDSTASTPNDVKKDTVAKSQPNIPDLELPAGNSPLGEDTITITRTFKFAGEVKTETKVVPALSSEGQDYLKEQKLKQEEEDRKEHLRGPRREPAKRKMSLIDEYKMNKTKKINTLEKSRLDWLGFVDKEGIRDDLTKHNKDGYLDRQGFLDRVDEKRESELRQQRAKQL